MKDKELVKFFLSDADEYYGLKEKKEEIINNNKNGDFFSFKKRKFIISSVVSCLLLAGAGFGIGYLIKGLDKNDYKDYSCYYRSLEESKEFFKKNYIDNYFDLIYSFSYLNKSIYNFYEIQDDNKTIAFQIYSINDNEEIVVDLENSRTSQTLTIKKEVNSYNQISVLSDSNFEINANDVIYGKVYVDTNFVKNITVNF